MNKLEKLAAELDKEFASGAKGSAEEGRDSKSAEWFEYVHQLLINDEAWMLDREPWTLAVDALEDMVKLLKKGIATPLMQQVLSEYLGEILSKVETERGHVAAIRNAYQILGLNRNGRPSKKREEINAALAYEIACREGATDEAALRLAWITYNGLEGADAVQLDKVMNKPAGDGSTHYKQSLEKIVIPLLHKSGARKPKSGGRPRKIPQKT